MRILIQRITFEKQNKSRLQTAGIPRITLVIFTLPNKKTKVKSSTKMFASLLRNNLSRIKYKGLPKDHSLYTSVGYQLAETSSKYTENTHKIYRTWAPFWYRLKMQKSTHRDLILIMFIEYNLNRRACVRQTGTKSRTCGTPRSRDMTPHLGMTPLGYDYGPYVILLVQLLFNRTDRAIRKYLDNIY